jgi:Ni/Fe-hydrogenase subunit HybB-like protein
MKVNVWQRGVPVYDAPLVNVQMFFLVLLVGSMLVIASLRMIGGLGPFSAMTDAYAWGIWKTFNVMTLTALGSGGFAVGIAAWVFNMKRLHVVMRMAMMTSLILYMTGLLGILIDVGRPWNFYHVLFPWRWNQHSAMLEVMICMPTYAVIFLTFENLPTWLERVYFFGKPSQKAWVESLVPKIRKVYPFVVSGAYLLPIMHQSSLGALLLSAGSKIHPLWQSQALPLLYVLQAGICGFAFVIFSLMASSVFWRRPLDREVLADLGWAMCVLTIFWSVLRVVDLAYRGHAADALTGDWYSILFLLEFSLALIPALVLLAPEARNDPKTLFEMTVLIGMGGLLYRFIPTTIAFRPGAPMGYFPSLTEVLVTLGLISISIIAYLIAVKRFAILPAPLSEWYAAMRHNEKQTQLEN